MWGRHLFRGAVHKDYKRPLRGIGQAAWAPNAGGPIAYGEPKARSVDEVSYAGRLLMALIGFQAPLIFMKPQ